MAYDGSIKIDGQIDSSGITKGVKQIESSLGSLNSIASVTAGIFAGISLIGFGKNALQSAANIELATVKMETLLGNAQQAQTMISDIIKMADVTPYGGEELIQAATTMKSFGISAKEIMPNLEALGNAAGGSKENLKGVANALGQVAAAGKMSGQDLLQFINAGIPILDLLGKRLKKSTGEIRQMVEAGKIGYKEVNGALQEFYTGNGKYAGLMKKAAQTLPGMYSTMQDSIMSFGREIVAVLTPALKSMMGSITEIFTKLSAWMKNLSPAAKENLLMFVKFVAVFGTLVIAIKAAQGAMLLFNAAVLANPLMWLIGVIALAVAAFGRLTRAMSDASLTGAQNEEMRKSVTALATEFKNLDGATKDSMKVQQEQKDMIGRVAKEFVNGVTSFNELKYGTAEYTKAVQDLTAKYQFLHDWGYKNNNLTETQKKGINSYKKALEDLIKTKSKNGMTMPDVDAPISGAPMGEDEKKQMNDRRKMWEDYYAWKNGEDIGQYAKELTSLQFSFVEKMLATEGDLELQKALMAKHEAERIDILKKNAKSEGLVSFMLGAGVSEQIAMGIDSGLYNIKQSVKGAAETIADVFEGMMDILSGSFDILSWMSDFKAQDIYDAFKGFLDGLQNFFDKELGNSSILLDAGAQALMTFIDGMIKNFPSISKSITNLILKIADFIDKNADKIIKFILDLVILVFKAIVKALPKLLKSVLDALIKAAPQIIRTLAQLIVEIINFISKNFNELAGAFLKLFLLAVTELVKQSPYIIAALVGMIPYFTQFIAVTMPIELVKQAPYIAAALIKAFAIAIPLAAVELVKNFTDVGKQIMQSIADGINAFPNLWEKIKDNFLKLKDKFGEAGKEIGSFFVDGLIEKITAPFNALIDLINGIIGKINSALSVSLPKWMGGYSFSPDIPYIDKLGSSSSGGTGSSVNIGEGTISSRSIDSIVEGLNSASSLSSMSASGVGSTTGGITLYNNMEGTLVVDGKAIGKIAYQNIDYFNRLAYGN